MHRQLGLPRLKLAGQHPLRVYACLELGIGACAILVHFLLPLVDLVYIAGAEHGMPGMLLRGFISAICLLPPTILMGASLPAIVRWVKSTPQRRLVVGAAVRRQHGGRGVRMPARGILPAADLQHGDRDVRGGGDQPGDRARELRAGGADSAPGDAQ